MRNRPSREPALDWHRPRQPLICEESFWTRLGTNVFLGWLRSPGRAARSLASRLISMGVWCDFGRNRRTEKTGAIYASNIAAARMNLPQRRDRPLLRELLTLDFGRLMGVVCYRLSRKSLLSAKKSCGKAFLAQWRLLFFSISTAFTNNVG